MSDEQRPRKRKPAPPTYKRRIRVDVAIVTGDGRHIAVASIYRDVRLARGEWPFTYTTVTIRKPVKK